MIDTPGVTTPTPPAINAAALRDGWIRTQSDTPFSLNRDARAGDIRFTGLGYSAIVLQVTGIGIGIDVPPIVEVPEVPALPPRVLPQVTIRATDEMLVSAITFEQVQGPIRFVTVAGQTTGMLSLRIVGENILNDATGMINTGVTPWQGRVNGLNAAGEVMSMDFTIGSPSVTVTVGGVPRAPIDIATFLTEVGEPRTAGTISPVVIGGRVYLPVRFILELFEIPHRIEGTTPADLVLFTG